MSRDGKTGSRGFKEAYDEEEKLGWRPEYEWTVCIPWLVSPAPQISLPFHITLGGVRFRASYWKRYERLIRKSTTWQEEKETMAPEIQEVFKGLCLSVKTKGRNAYEAWERAVHPFYALRGIIEFLLGYRAWKWSDTPRPLCEFPPPSIVVVLSKEGEPVFLRNLDEQRDTEEKVITLRYLKMVQKYVRFLRKHHDDGTIDRVLFDAFGCYAQAMEERVPSRAFIAWWQITETLTLSRNFRGQTREVIRRLEWVCSQCMKADLTGFVECWEEFASRRNDLVHRGCTGYIDMEDNRFVKQFCDTLFAWLLQNRRKLPTISILENSYKDRRMPERE